MSFLFSDMDPDAMCQCNHPRFVHELGISNDPRASELLKDAEKYCHTTNVCGRRQCPCSKFVPKKVAA